MTTSVQRRRGTTTQHTTFTGLEGELTIDTSKDTAVIHDGATVGGFPLAKEGLENTKTTNLNAITGADTAADDTFLIYDTSASAMKRITRAELNNAIEKEPLSNVTINSGSIDGTTIGATTASTGKFSTLTNAALTSGRVTYAGTAGLLQDSANLTFNGTTLTSTGFAGPISGVVTSTSITDSGLTSGRVTYAGTGGLLQDDADLTFDGSTLTTLNSAYTGTLTGGTGVVNLGSGQFYKDASGNVGIGTSSPAYALDVRGDGIKGRFGNTTIGCTLGTYVNGTLWGFANNNGNGGMFGDASNYIYFASAGTERMRINSSGNVGIGTSSPAVKLEVSSGTTNTAIRATNTTSIFEIQSNSNDGYINMTGTGNTIFRNGAGFTERMRIDSSGNVGIGVTPSAWAGLSYKALEIGAAGNAIYAGFNDTNMSTNAYYASGWKYAGANYASLAQQNSGKHIWYNAPIGTAGAAITFTQAMTLDASGNLLVGTTTSGLGAAGRGTLEINGTSESIIGLKVNNAVKTYLYQAGENVELNNTGSGAMAFKSTTFINMNTAGTERMRINSSGNVGIGTSSPNGVVQIGINGNGLDNDLVLFASGTDVGAKSYLRFDMNVAGGNALSKIAEIQGISYQNSGNNQLRFNVGSWNNNNSASTVMTLQSNSFVGINTDAPQARLDIRATAFTPTQYATPAVTIEESYAWSQGLQFFINNAGTFFSSRPSGALGSANGNGLWLTAGAIITNNPDASNGFTATASAASVYRPVDGAHVWFGNTGLTAGNTFTTTERMRIDSSGNLLVNTSSVLLAGAGSIQAQAIGTGGAIMSKSSEWSTYTQYIWNATTANNSRFVSFNTEGTITQRGSIDYNRGAGLTAYNTTSDYRAKDIYGSIVDSGEVIDSVPVYMGKMKDATQARPMFIAHETPDYAHTGEKDAVDKDGNPVYQQMDASSLVPVLWAEIQSLRKRVAQLESK